MLPTLKMNHRNIQKENVKKIEKKKLNMCFYIINKYLRINIFIPTK